MTAGVEELSSRICYGERLGTPHRTPATIDKGYYEAHKKQRGDLINGILREARVVYCTCTSLRNRALHFETVSKDKKGPGVIAWPAATCTFEQGAASVGVDGGTSARENEEVHNSAGPF